jgi:hypothetical protein
MKHLQPTSKTDKTLETYVYSHNNMSTCAIADLLLKHPDATLAAYKRRQMTHLKKILKKHLKPY